MDYKVIKEFFQEKELLKKKFYCSDNNNEKKNLENHKKLYRKIKKAKMENKHKYELIRLIAYFEPAFTDMRKYQFINFAKIVVSINVQIAKLELAKNKIKEKEIMYYIEGLIERMFENKYEYITNKDKVKNLKFFFQRINEIEIKHEQYRSELNRFFFNIVYQVSTGVTNDINCVEDAILPYNEIKQIIE